MVKSFLQVKKNQPYELHKTTMHYIKQHINWIQISIAKEHFFDSHTRQKTMH